MKTTFKILQSFREKYTLLIFVLGVLLGIFTFFHNLLNKYDEVIKKLNTTQQMSLKSVIWNEGIPLDERAGACDVYLNAGYNSLTKKKCETIISKSISDNSTQLKTY